MSLEKFCSKCKETQIGNYCAQCGTKLIEYKPRFTCPSCGREVHRLDYFCWMCGAKLGHVLIPPHRN